MSTGSAVARYVIGSQITSPILTFRHASTCRLTESRSFAIDRGFGRPIDKAIGHASAPPSSLAWRFAALSQWRRSNCLSSIGDFIGTVFSSSALRAERYAGSRLGEPSYFASRRSHLFKDFPGNRCKACLLLWSLHTDDFPCVLFKEPNFLVGCNEDRMQPKHSKRLNNSSCC